MTDLPDWAKDKALECYLEIWPGAPRDTVELDVPIIAAALVGGHKVAVERAMQAGREAVLAEVRRVVEGILPPYADDHRKAEGDDATLDRYWTGWTDCCDTILASLEKLE